MSTGAVLRSADLDEQFIRWLSPVAGEVDYEITAIEGEVPRDLHGTFLGNGPSQQQLPPEGAQAMHFFDGDAYLRSLRFEAGRVRYRTRYVRTPSFLAEQEQGRFCMTSFGLAANDPIGMGRHEPNTNIVVHANRAFALVENAAPFELDPDTLEPIGPWDYDGRMLGMSTSAHPKRDPLTGQLLVHGYQPFPPYVSLYCVEADGSLSLAETFDAPWPSMMHDMAISRGHVVLPLGPVVFDLETVASGAPFQAAFRFDPERPLLFGVRSRQAASTIRWVEAPTQGFIFHTCNAYEEAGVLHLDAATFRDVDRAFSDLASMRSAAMRSGLAAVPVHYEIDLESGVCRERQRSDVALELPRIDERRLGAKHRYAYALASRPDPACEADATFTAIVKHDFESDGHDLHVLPPAHWTGEPVFIARSPEAAEDDGYVISAIYDGNRDRSGFQILSAARIEAEPLAKLWLEERSPLGFHGNFIAGMV